MLVKFEETKNNSILLVTDELDRFLGKVCGFDFAECLEESDPITLEDGYLYWNANKECLLKYIKW